jgi:hypothetical protein
MKFIHVVALCPNPLYRCCIQRCPCRAQPPSLRCPSPATLPANPQWYVVTQNATNVPLVSTTSVSASLDGPIRHIAEIINECRELDPPPCLFAGAVCVDEDSSPRRPSRWQVSLRLQDQGGMGQRSDLRRARSSRLWRLWTSAPKKLRNVIRMQRAPTSSLDSICTCNDGFVGDGIVSCLSVVKPIESSARSTSKCGKKCLKSNSNAYCDETQGQVCLS